jgi:FlaA1/EpsC-like NDP-sugar epimerase
MQPRRLAPFLRRFHLRSVGVSHVLLDGVLLTLSMYVSLWLRVGEQGWPEDVQHLNRLVLWFLLLKLIVFLSLGVYQSVWRYVSSHDAQRLGFAIITCVPLLVSLTYFFPDWGYLPRSFFVIDLFLSLSLLTGLRLLRRRVFEWQMGVKHGVNAPLDKVLIYGAGQNGRLLAQRLLSDPRRERELLGFLDDGREFELRNIQGLPVLGGRSDVEKIVKASGCTELVVAITTPPADLMRDLVLVARRNNVRLMKIAHLQDAALGEALYQRVELSDLLNRPGTPIDVSAVRQRIESRVVLITGAGGSIGSELARQVARFHPKKLLLLDHSELSLFEIDRELRPSTQDFSSVKPLLVDIKDEATLRRVFSFERPEIVFHAAAYKHVHLVEANVASSVLNNVGGTRHLLTLSEEFGVEQFVLVSTDKAVRPQGAMGCTKRVCERMTTQAGLRSGKRFSSVRFGNVLGSSGSLIPILRKQIEDGGPITITHPDMNRYFMLIPEAVSLVLMSATISEPGDINVLKMGDPIPIVDLARNLLALMGKSEEDIPIVFTGVRPGEKMSEELYLTGAELATRHPDILTLPRGDGSRTQNLGDLEREVHGLLQMASTESPSTLSQLKELARH